MDVLALIKPLIELYTGNQGAIVQVISILGTARLFVKPLMSLAQAYVQATPSPSDNEALNKFMQSKTYMMISYIVDWSLSIKLPSAQAKVFTFPTPVDPPAAS